MTNLEWIRSLDEEALARGFVEAQEPGTLYPWCRNVPARTCLDSTCERCLARWLAEPRTEEAPGDPEAPPWEEAP